MEKAKTASSTSHSSGIRWRRSMLPHLGSRGRSVTDCLFLFIAVAMAVAMALVSSLS